MVDKTRVLFLCTGNSARSQMAEAVVNNDCWDKWVAYSAGTNPALAVNPYALRVLEKACSIASLEGGKRQVTAQHLLRAVAMITNASALSEEEECGREQILKALEKTAKGQDSALK